MARKTINGLEEVIADLEKKINEYMNIINNRNKQIEQMENIADDSFENSPAYRRMKKEIKGLETIIESHEITIKGKDDTIKKNRDTIQELLNENEQLKYNGNNVHKIKNERGAGRKTKINDDIIRTVYMLKLQNKSVRAIAEKIGLSVGTVQKIITEHIKDMQ